MSELKAFEVTGKALFGRFYTKKVYDKSEADKVIADLEESHKKEVEQLLMEIVKLKEERRWRKFSKEKPDDKQVVLVHGEEWFETAIYHDDDSIDFGDDIHFSNITEVPYWMPLPKKPEEADK